MIVGGIGDAQSAACVDASVPSSTPNKLSDRIPREVQAARDDDRRSILRQEMQNEQSTLQSLGTPSAGEGQERWATRRRTLSNIEALQRELQRLN